MVDLKIENRLTTTEERSVGNISCSVYGNYFHSMGSYWIVVLLLLFYGIDEGIYVFNNTWLTVWTDAMKSVTNERPTSYYMWVYIGVAIICVLFGCLTTFMMRYYGIVSANVFDISISRIYMLACSTQFYTIQCHFLIQHHLVE